MSQFDLKKALLDLKGTLFTDPKYAKSTNEVVKLFNDSFPHSVRFKAASVRTSVEDMNRLGGVYKVYHDQDTATVELFKNWNQLIPFGESWFNKFVGVVTSNKVINTYSQESRTRHKLAVAQYSMDKVVEPASTIKLAMEKNPAFKEMIARANLAGYEDGEGDTTESRRIIWIYDYYKKLEKANDLLFMRMPDFRALMSKQYKGDYRIVADRAFCSERELIKFIKGDLKLTPIIKQLSNERWFEYPSDEEIERIKSPESTTVTVYNGSSDNIRRFKTSRLDTAGDKPSDYGARASTIPEFVLKQLLSEFWTLLAHKLNAAEIGSIKESVKDLQELLKKAVYTQGSIIKQGKPLKSPVLNAYPFIDKLMKGYFTAKRFRDLLVIYEKRQEAERTRVANLKAAQERHKQTLNKNQD